MEEKSAGFTGVKVFSATMAQARHELGETVTDWLAAHREIEIVDIRTLQSSDSRFHCVTVCVFYR